MAVDFSKIDKALIQLESALSQDIKNDLERDGVIQRFEYTVELLWKISKKVLQESGVTAVAPKEVIKELANIGWINNPEEFLTYLKMRNESSHSYKEEVAKLIFESAKGFAPACNALIKILKEKDQ